MGRNIIAELRKRYPWPDAKPDLPFDGHGWFGWCHKAMLDIVLPKKAFVIVELGSWLGCSTRHILDSAPQTTVIAVDHWKGDESILRDCDQETKDKLDRLYERFLANCWDYKDRLIPMRATTLDALQEMHGLGLKPQFIYLDASHEYADVVKDLDMIGALYPGVRLGGDDYGGKWVGLKKAVDDYAAKMGFVVCTAEHAWTLALPKEVELLDSGLASAKRFRKDEMDRAAKKLKEEQEKEAEKKKAEERRKAAEKERREAEAKASAEAKRLAELAEPAVEPKEEKDQESDG